MTIPDPGTPSVQAPHPLAQAAPGHGPGQAPVPAPAPGPDPHAAAPAVLVGVGTGPGDPDLVTVRAVRTLREADVVLVPVVEEADHGRAEATVLAHLDEADHAKVRRLQFTMSRERGVTARRAGAWEAAADAALAAFADGVRLVAFATIGDPNVYSTFSYVAQTVTARRPGTLVRTEPGITAMQDLASRAGVPLCEGRETLALFPGTAGDDALEQVLAAADTVVTYKAGRRLPELVELLRRTGRLEGTVVGTELGLPGERLTPAADLAPDEVAGYLTAVLVPARRDGRGARL